MVELDDLLHELWAIKVLELKGGIASLKCP